MSAADTMRRFYELFAARDEEAMRAMVGECVWRIPGKGLLAAEYRGPDEILGMFQHAAKLTEGSLQLEVHDIVGDEHHAVGLDRVRGRRADGRTIDMNRVVIAHISDGSITELWLCPEDQYAFDEFWG